MSHRTGSAGRAFQLGCIALGILAAQAVTARELPSLVHAQAGRVGAAVPGVESAYDALRLIPSSIPDGLGGPGQKVVIDNGAQEDFFGWSVAIDGSTAVLGAYGVTVNGHTQQGAAYVFTEADGIWTLAATLTADDGAPFDIFGSEVSLSGTVAAIGAYQADHSRGAVYVFTGSGGQWTQKARLAADDGASQDCLGWSVAVSDSTVIAGAPFAIVDNRQTGAVYVFAPVGGAWGQRQKLTASDAQLGDFFGDAVAIDGATAVIGADSATVDGHVVQGAAYVFDGTSGSWTEQAKLTSDDGAAYDNFGRSVAVSGATALIGAPYASSYEGAAYVFDGNGTDWHPGQKLLASDGAPDGYFGWSVALSGDLALVGAGSYSDQNPGHAYVFARSGGVWSETDEKSSGDGAGADYFGWSVAVSGTNALVGEPIATVGANYAQGAAFFYGGSDDVIFANGFDTD